MFDTERYMLVPYEYHSTGSERECLSAMFDMDPSCEVRAADMPECGAAIIYALPYPGFGDDVPAVCRMLDMLKTLSVAHKLLVRFSEGLVTVVLADRDHLLLACSYPVVSFSDALFYIFTAMKEVLYEPDHTALHFSGFVDDDGKSLLKRYFEQVIPIDIE